MPVTHALGLEHAVENIFPPEADRLFTQSALLVSSLRLCLRPCPRRLHAMVSAFVFLSKYAKFVFVHKDTYPSGMYGSVQTEKKNTKTKTNTNEQKLEFKGQTRMENNVGYA